MYWFSSNTKKYTNSKKQLIIDLWKEFALFMNIDKEVVRNIIWFFMCTIIGAILKH